MYYYWGKGYLKNINVICNYIYIFILVKNKLLEWEKYGSLFLDFLVLII